MATTQFETRVQRHPIRGGFYGLLLGLSAAIYLIIFSVTPFRISTVIVVCVVGILIGALWGSVAPASKPPDVPPNTRAFGSVYTSAADEGPAPTYEETFGSGTPAKDDGAFGAPEAADEPAFEMPPESDLGDDDTSAPGTSA